MKRWLNKWQAAAKKMEELKFFRWILFILTVLLLFVSMYSNVRKEKLDIDLFSIADRTIRSPITIEDKESTEKKRKEAVAQVKDVYVLRQEYAQNRVDLVRSIFDAAIETLEGNKEGKGEGGGLPPTTEERLKDLKESLTEPVAKEISDATFLALASASKNELSVAKDYTVTAVHKVMNERIPANEVENAKKRVEETLRITAMPENLKNAAVELARHAIVQNEFYDPEATEELRKQAAENVEPVKILQGQVIVEEGQLVTPEIYRQLKLLGLMDGKDSFLPLIGLLLLSVMLASVLFAGHMHLLGRERKENRRDLFISILIFLIGLGIMKVLSFVKNDAFEITFLFPAAMGVMLGKLLISEAKGILITIAWALCGTVIFNGESSGAFHITAGIYILLSGLSSIVFLTNRNHRSKIFQAGLFVSAVNIAVITALFFIPDSRMSALHYGYYYLTGIGSGIGSAVLTIGILPFFEAGFGILSSMKLIELANPNHPLLKKILTDAPGTYHHSVMVANLAEAACEAIGANGLLARVGSYYHDAGKIKRPMYFIENQNNISNPHEHLNPVQSRNIIIAHTSDGAEILEKHRMPKEIVAIAREHHGTSVLKYFYVKAKEAGLDVKEDEFRYPGPKPRTKEAAVISIADSVEAAVRTVNDPDRKKIESLVKNIIKDRLNDGQFEECDITLKELKTVEKTICETLYGFFHHRIEYPS